MNTEHVFAQALLRAWPFPRGAGRLIDRFFSEVVFDQHVASIKTTDGFKMKVLPNDLIGRHLYLTGEFDRSNVEVLCNFAEPGDILLDVGANFGYVSACFLKKILDSQVLAIEPQPVILDLLRENLSQFGCRQTVFSFALSDKDGEAWFDVDVKNKGASHLVTDPSAGAVRVDIRSADGFFDQLNLPKLDLVKIDVEGHEEEVLTSCKGALARLQPRAIIFEEHADKCAPDKVLGKLFDDIGYLVYGIKKTLSRLQLIQISSSSDCTFNDYVALSRSRAIPRLAKTVYGL